MSKKNMHTIELMIEKLDTPGEVLSIDQAEKIEEELFREIDEAKPEYLYKYRKGNSEDLDALKNKKIYLSSPAKLNDPTESMSFVDADEMVRLALGISYDLELCEASEEDDLVINNLLKRVDVMNNGISYIQSNRERIKICSLSETIDSQLMWSHYADEHRGYAVRYKTESFFMAECDGCSEVNKRICHRCCCPLFPVVYKDERFNATRIAFDVAINKAMNKEFDDRLYPFPLLTVLQKAKDWSYEREWRVVCNDIEREFFSVNPDAIIMGDLIDGELACKLASIARTHNIKLYKSSFNYLESNFAIKIDDWSDYKDKDIVKFVHKEGPKYG